VREAFELALDREGIVQVVMEGQAAVGNQWVAPDNPFYAKNMPVPKRDVARAKALLAEAGVTNPTVKFAYATDNPRRASEFQLLQASAALAGINVVDVGKPGSEFFGDSGLGSGKYDYDACVFAW